MQVQVHILAYGRPVILTLFVERLFCLHKIALASWSKISCPRACGSIWAFYCSVGLSAYLYANATLSVSPQTLFIFKVVLAF